MRNAAMFALCFVFSFASLAGAEEVVKPERLEKLSTAIPEGIRLLEAKEYVVFLKSFVAPSDLKMITERSSLEEFAKKFGETKGPRMLEVLKEIKEAKPSLDATETKATFALKEEIGPKKSITFAKQEKRWYIQN